MPTYLTTKEVVSLLRIPLASLYKQMADGKLPYYRVGRRALFDQAELLAWVETQRRGPKVQG